MIFILFLLLVIINYLITNHNYSMLLFLYYESFSHIFHLTHLITNLKVHQMVRLYFIKFLQTYTLFNEQIFHSY